MAIILTEEQRNKRKLTRFHLLPLYFYVLSGGICPMWGIMFPTATLVVRLTVTSNVVIWFWIN